MMQFVAHEFSMSILKAFREEKLQAVDNFLFLLWDGCDEGSDGKREGRPARFGKTEKIGDSLVTVGSLVAGNSLVPCEELRKTGA
ncbi:hypothetical protein PtA15_2A424 [Puccinia triticina]|uniref:Uncharacterized protein n=1 Tax=Puccinia triticina TaxID=208348 RepID=A0ABY7CAA6_9BASI|nr:uncharacterized protein PtA15_2A424 [Puccinia triticina]WAQ82111.1 hypothetical protein PtA15_2A424 [Puccinia triticina]WAR52974.1 hypothetical protein PtB15_2B402 [Puccinia triticina]